MASFGGSTWAIKSFMLGDFFNRAVATIYTFRGYMEQIAFDSSDLLRKATFSEDLSLAFDFFNGSLSILPL